MSMGARKRAADDISATKACREIDTYSDGEECFREFQEAERAKYRIGERLRPCPGCKACGVRRFSRVGGFEDGTAFIEHRPGRCRLFRVPGKAWTYSGGMRRSITAEHYQLSVCENYVASGQWEELTKPICFGAGLLPARRKARR